MKNFDTRVYNIADFIEWHGNGLLELSPDFQRRAVWSEKAKSYLADTIIRGKPIPKILITQDLKGPRTVRVVVDGQQRLRAILEFVEGAVKISRAHNPEYGGYTFSRLPNAVQRDFLKYELGVDLLFDLAYEDVLDIFARLNSYTVKLNQQELLNATYLGYFKQAAYKCGFAYVRYFLDSSVLTKAAITRMAEAELAADLLMALVGGVQSNKNVERFYRMYEDEEGPVPDGVRQFDEVMTIIGDLYSPAELGLTNWSRIHLFYTLFTVVAHALFGLEGLDQAPRITISQKTLRTIRVALDEISAKYDQVAANEVDSTATADYRAFIDRARRRTTDTGARVFRAEFVAQQLQRALE